jgi:hypothetical protein
MDERVTSSDFPIRADAQTESTNTVDVANAGIDLRLANCPEVVT